MVSLRIRIVLVGSAHRYLSSVIEWLPQIIVKGNLRRSKSVRCRDIYLIWGCSKRYPYAHVGAGDVQIGSRVLSQIHKARSAPLASAAHIAVWMEVAYDVDRPAF